jgi:hypothetical protein
MAATGYGLRDHAQTCAICWNGSVDTGPDEPTRERAPDDRLSDIRYFHNTK